MCIHGRMSSTVAFGKLKKKDAFHTTDAYGDGYGRKAYYEWNSLRLCMLESSHVAPISICHTFQHRNFRGAQAALRFETYCRLLSGHAM